MDDGFRIIKMFHWNNTIKSIKMCVCFTTYSTLVGEGAVTWAENHGIPLTPAEHMITGDI